MNIIIREENKNDHNNHEDYYPRFGFKLASNYGIKIPFEVPNNAFMATELVEGGLDGVEGVVIYSKAFFE